MTYCSHVYTDIMTSVDLLTIRTFDLMAVWTYESAVGPYELYKFISRKNLMLIFYPGKKLMTILKETQ